MQVSNILSVLKTKQFEFGSLVTSHDPFLELARETYIEIHAQNGKYTLVEKSSAHLPILMDNSNTFSNVVDLIESSLSNRKIILSVNTDLCLQYNSHFPISARSKIEQLSQLELQRVTPFEPADVFLGWIIDGENENTVFTRQFVLKKAIVLEVQELLLQHKKSIEAIFIRDISGNAIELAFAPSGEMFGLQSFKNWKKKLGISLGIFAISTAVLVSGIYSFSVRQFEETSIAIANFQPEIKKVEQKIKNTQKRYASIQAMQKLQRETVSRLGLIEEVTRLLPDTAYALNLSVFDNRVLLEGSANSPEKLIPLFESSSLFKNVVFGSAIFNSPGETQSHFALNMDLELSN